MNEKKFKEIATKLKHEALAQCGIFPFAKVVQETPINAEDNGHETKNVILTEIGMGVEYSPDDFLRFDNGNIMQNHLISQLSIVLDSIAILAFKSTPLKAIPVHLSPFIGNPSILPNEHHREIHLDINGVPSIVATANMNSVLCQVISNYMEKTSVPYFDNNGYYFGLGSVKLLRSLKCDPNIRKPQDYLSKGDVFYNDEVGESGSIRWSEITHTHHLSNHMGARGAFGEGIVFGDNGIIVWEVKPVELRIIDDKLVAWCGLIACGLAPNATVIHITSAEEAAHD